MCVLVQGESMVGCSIKPISGLPQRSFYFALYLIKQKNTFSISLPELVSSEHFDALKWSLKLVAGPPWYNCVHKEKIAQENII